MSQEKWKKNSAEEAAKLVKDNMLVGLGSGTTVAQVVRTLRENGTEAEFVTASVSTQKLAKKMNLSITSLESDEELDLAIDGADEVNQNLQMLKGGGGSHTRERIVASAAKKLAIVIDKTKIVKKLGEKNPLPVEIIPFAHEYTAGKVQEFGTEARFRKSETDQLYVTDNGNYIVDLELDVINEPKKLYKKLNQTPGVVDNGIFTKKPNYIYIGYEEGCQTINTRKQFEEFFQKTKI